MKNRPLFPKTILAAGLLLFCAGCFAPPAAPTSTPTPTASSTPTPTPVWFPPTLTPSPFPTPQVSPTTDLRTGIGELILEDDFSDPAPWDTASDALASVTVSNDNIHLSLKSNQSYLISTRNTPTFTDVYAEITAHVSICNGQDEYGLIVRANEDGDHFRLALSCDGQVKVDSFHNGSLSRQAGWFATRAVPALAPSSARLGVWARGSQMLFFVNDLYLFSVTDTQIFKGNVGVFVHTAGEGDVSVSFSDLQVWHVEK